MVANAAAGAHDRTAIQEAVGSLAEHAPVELRWSDGPDSLADAADHLDGRRLVVAGGDGSLHALVNALDLRRLGEIEVAVLPVGTGNDLARSLDVPLDPSAAARLAATGEAAPVALIELRIGAHRRLVVNAVHGGVGVDAGRGAQRWKGRLGAVAYPIGALAAGLRFTAPEVRIEADSCPMPPRAALLVAVANGASVGGGAPVAPHAEPSAGRLELIVAWDRGRLGRLRFGAALLRGRHLGQRGVERRAATSVRVAGLDELNVDGELVAAPEPWEARVLPGAWRVVRGDVGEEAQ
ncbi:MAG: diacylglycerol/lipid kinase family protein [Acidimicrobiales bacterium]